METMSHLAIASIPVQEWNEVYDEAQGFRIGTIFPELNKPFFVTVFDRELEKKTVGTGLDFKSQEGMLFQIQQVGFVLDDLRLYLDTHPEDKEGIKLLKSMLKRKKLLMKEFALQFYPLTPECMADIYENNPDEEEYSWPKGRIPWERSV